MMSQPAFQEYPVERCRRLRTKSMFIHTEQDTTVQGSNPIFWCLHTQNCLGPDGQVVTLQNCCGGRECYEPI
jgi:hypothetical protein